MLLIQSFEFYMIKCSNVSSEVSSTAFTLKRTFFTRLNEPSLFYCCFFFIFLAENVTRITAKEFPGIHVPSIKYGNGFVCGGVGDVVHIWTLGTKCEVVEHLLEKEQEIQSSLSSAWSCFFF